MTKEEVLYELAWLKSFYNNVKTEDTLRQLNSQIRYYENLKKELSEND